ncbi:MAG: HEAT repeat domain-containing protein, partial [Verrucomicrobia bacterium]|nr:HEAT repeat domain-containing protein [Verrucomicrobiota bacterium]
AALPRLRTLLGDSDSAVRYWAALGFLMRGQPGVAAGQPALRNALADSSPYVRIVAAEALIRHGPESDLPASLAVLSELAPVEKHGVFVSMAALSAIEAIGPKGAPVHEVVRTMKPSGPSPDNRFDSYVPRLIENIAPNATKSGETAPAKTRGKRKAAAK